MIGYLEGKLIDVAENQVLIGVGAAESGGIVGYRVLTPSNAVYQGLKKGSQARFFIHSHVREDAFDLYGFISNEEREVFLAALRVSGIGPKAALAILSYAEPSQVIRAILDRDHAFLTRVPGIGKKTVERIFLELGDKIQKQVQEGTFSLPSSDSESLPQGGSPVAEGMVFHETKQALISLGFRDQDVSPILKGILKKKESPPRSEELVRLALQQLG